MIIEIRKPSAPRSAMPIAETLVIVWNSFLEGFFSTSQTRRHFIAKDFVAVHNFIAEKV